MRKLFLILLSVFFCNSVIACKTGDFQIWTNIYGKKWAFKEPGGGPVRAEILERKYQLCQSRDTSRPPHNYYLNVTFNVRCAGRWVKCLKYDAKFLDQRGGPLGFKMMGTSISCRDRGNYNYKSKDYPVDEGFTKKLREVSEGAISWMDTGDCP